MQSKDSVARSKVERLQAAGQILYLWQPSINMWLGVSRPLSSLGCWYLFVLGGHRKNRQYLSAPRRWQLSKMLIPWMIVWWTLLWRGEFLPECLHADSARTFVWMKKKSITTLLFWCCDSHCMDPPGTSLWCSCPNVCAHDAGDSRQTLHFLKSLAPLPLLKKEDVSKRGNIICLCQQVASLFIAFTASWTPDPVFPVSSDASAWYLFWQNKLNIVSKNVGNPLHNPLEAFFSNHEGFSLAARNNCWGYYYCPPPPAPAASPSPRWSPSWARWLGDQRMGVRYGWSTASGLSSRASHDRDEVADWQSRMPTTQTLGYRKLYPGIRDLWRDSSPFHRSDKSLIKFRAEKFFVGV